MMYNCSTDVHCIVLQEAAIIGVDSLGFDLRICSGTQIQTLRFGFNTRVCLLCLDFFFSIY